MENTRQNRIVKWIASFFLLMLILTIFSRGMAGATMAKVSTVHPYRGMINQTEFGSFGSTYDYVIPIEAYHYDNQGSFVYVIEEQSTLLGLQFVVCREAVELLEAGEQYVAVDGNIYPDSEIICYTTKSIKKGQNVKPME